MSIIKTIQKYPEVIDNNHESIYKAYHILELTKVMLRRRDSIESILMIIDECELK